MNSRSDALFSCTNLTSTTTAASVSCSFLRYVEIQPEEEGNEVPAISMWTLSGRPESWSLTYQIRFAEIWNDRSYLETGLPQEIPMIVTVCPSNSGVIYFSVEVIIFAVNVPMHRVLKCGEKGDEFVTMLWPATPSSYRVLPWPLPPSVHEGSVFKEDLADQDKIALAYAKFCYARELILLNKKGFDLCHICYFKDDNAKPVCKTGMKDHCIRYHNTQGYPCTKKGCLIRMGTLGEAGQHEFCCHEQKTSGWWRQLV